MYPNTATRLMCINRICASETGAKEAKSRSLLVYGLTLLAIISSFFANAKMGAGMEKEKAVAQTRTSLVLEIGKALQQKDAETKFFRLFNGGASQPSDFWKARLAILANSPQTALAIDIQQLTNEQLKGAFGAFTRKGVNGQPAIYLNQNWLEKQASKAGLQRVLAEEMGHALDYYLNGNLETPGDEGEAFAHSLLKQNLTEQDVHRIDTEDDFSSLVLEGKEVIIEEAAIYINEVNVGAGTGYALQSSRLYSITQVSGTGFKFTSVDPNAALFSYDVNGNDISGTLSYVNTSGTLVTIPGVMSRQEKQGSTTRAFYFLDPATTKAYLLVVPGFESTFTSGDVGTSSDPNFLNDLNGVLATQNSSPRIVVSSPAINENADFAIFSITRTNTPTGTYTFTPAIVAGSATAGSDYTAAMEYRNSATSNLWTPVSGSLSIAASITLTELRVAVADDNIVEGNEDFSVNTGAISGGGILNNGGTFGLATIQDNDAPAPTITVSPNPIVKTYGDPAFHIAVNSNSNGTITFAVTGNSGVITWNSTNSNYDIVSAGTTQVTISQAATSSYSSGNMVVNVTVNPRILTAIASATGKVYDGNNTANVALNDNRINGDVLTINRTSATFSDANVGTGKTVTVTGLSLSGAAAANYTLAATTATTTANITAKAVTVAVTPATKVYGNIEPTFVGTPTGLVGQDQLSGAITRAAGSTVGTYAFSGLANSNYTITYSPANFSITARPLTVTATAAPKVYDGNTAAVETLSDDRVSGDQFTVSNTGATFSDANVGNGKTVTVAGLSISGAAAANYTLANTTASATANITAKAVTVTVTPATKVYGNAEPTFTGTPTGLVNGEQFTGTITRAPGTAVGNYAFSGLANNNYTITYSPANFSITARTLTVTATAANKVYDGNTNATESLNDNRVSGDQITVAHTGATFNNANVGTGKTVTVAGLSLSGAAAANYTLAATTVTTTADITAKAVTVTVAPATKVYGNNEPSFTYTPTGLIGQEQLTGTITRAAGNAVGSYAFGGLSNGNYTITYSPANFGITARTLTVTATASNKIYDGNTAASENLTDDRVSGDQLTVAHSTATFNNANVGTGKTVTVAGLSLSGADAANYTLAANTITAIANITAKAVTVTVAPATKVYGNTDPTFTGTPTGLVNGEQLTGTITRAPGTAVGNYTFSGLANSNYTITYSPANFGITARTLTVTATASNKPYDGNATAVVNLADNRIGGDVLTVNYTAATFNNANAGTAKPVTVAGISISGAAAANYTLAANSAATTANITAVPVTVAVSPVSKPLGTTDPVFTYTATGLLGQDLLTGTLVRTAGETMGNYGFSGLSNNNYTISYTPASFTITQSPLAISAQPQGAALCQGGTLSLSVTAVNATGYHWYKNNVAIAGATSATYTKSNVNTADAGTYTVIVSAAGNITVTSANATVTVSPAVTAAIGTTGSAAYCPGSSIVLTANAGAVSYQWMRNGTAINGATARTYTATAPGSYTVTINMGTACGTTTSAAFVYAIDPAGDCDGDGIINGIECPSLGASCEDTDGDGTPDYLDLDSDGDGISDAIEKGPSGTPVDTDSDGVPDFRDLDSDNDGISDAIEKGPSATPVDTDGDGVPDFRELDSDNDGIPDATEKGPNANPRDTDGDGVPDFRDLDSDNDGIPDAIEKGPSGTPVDTDGDGTPDFRDLDSDGDGIPDNTEKGPSATPVDTDGDGVPDFRDLDTDNDGIPDAIEKGPTGTPVDTDGDGVPDFRELDSDNDGIPDATEKGPNATPRDTDGDGVPDFRELDSDNDGIPDATERGTGGTPIDTDGDGTPDFRDLDSDNDGITDATERGNGSQPIDTDGDGTPDYRETDSDNDGISDRTERGSAATPIDTDGDGIPDYRELDSDNDGKPDNQEGGTEDCDGDGIPNFRDEQECVINILVPDVFTPNGDGINDEIKPVLPGIVTFKSFKVFNRWGNLLYETREVNKGWNGRYQGSLQPTETYLWFAEAVGKDGRTIIKRGTLSLLR